MFGATVVKVIPNGPLKTIYLIFWGHFCIIKLYMKKTLKILALALALVLASVLAAFLALKFYFTPDRIRKLAMEYAEHNLRREISLDAASLNLRGFSLRNFKVAEAGGFKKGAFLSAEDFSVRPDFRALLRKELRIRSIYASGVTLNILQVKKDDYNFSDLLAAPPAAAAKKPAPGAQAKPMELSVSDINVRNSRVVYANADRSMTVTLSGLDLKASSLTSGALFPFETSFTLALRSSYLSGDFPVYAKGRTALGGWNPEKGRAEIDKASLKAGKISCEFSGSFENLVEPDAKISLRVNAFSTTDLKPYFPDAPAHILLPALAADSVFKLTSANILFKTLDFKAGPAQGALKGRLGWNPVFDYDLAADIKVQTPELDTTEVARKFHSIPKNIKVPLADISAKLALSPKKIRVLSASVAAKSLKADTAGEFTMSPAFAASGRVNLNAGSLRDLGEMMPQLRDYDLGGSASGDFAFAMAKELDLSGRLTLNGASAKAADYRFTEMSGTADFSKDLLKADVSGKMEGSPLKLSLSVKNYSAHPQAVLNADLAALTLKAQTAPGGTDKAKPAAKKAADRGAFSFDISGKTRLGAISHPNFKGGETTIKYDLKNLSAELSGLSGSASFGVAGGELDDLQQFANTSKTARIVFYPLLVLGKASRIVPSLKLPDLTRVKFTKMEGDYLFRDGVMKVEKSQFRSDAADADTAGSIDLANEALDLKVSATPKSGIILSAPIGMTIKGSFDNPSVKPDVASLLKQPAVKDAVQRLLKGFLK